VENGKLVGRELGARARGKAQRSRHTPNPNRGVQARAESGSASSVVWAVNPAEIKQLNNRRKQLLAEATKAGLMGTSSTHEVLSQNLQKRLKAEISNVRGAAAVEAEQVALGTIALMMVKIQTRANNDSRRYGINSVVARNLRPQAS